MNFEKIIDDYWASNNRNGGGRQPSVKEEIQRKRILEAERRAASNFANKIDYAYQTFLQRGYSPEQATSFAIAFYKDMDVAKRRAKREEKIMED